MERNEARAERMDVVVREVVVRPARADERRRWDALMAEHHYLGFRQFAGRGLRHVAEWRGRWVALAGWQSGAFKCGPRDRWLGWHREVQFRRLHLIGNNTRFLVLPEASGTPGLASRALSRSLRRLSADWREAHGHPLELAETFVDPSRFKGTCYLASNWTPVGRTKGFARHNGQYTDAQGSRKEMYVRPLRADARRRLADAEERPEWGSPKARASSWRTDELRSLRDLFAELPDCRRGQGKMHRLPTVLSLVVLARLSGRSGPAATERCAKALSQQELGALGAWRNPRTGKLAAPSDSTFCRVMADLDPDALRQVEARWSAPRAEADAAREEAAAREREAAAGGRDIRDRFDRRALSADGKRIRGANRNAGGARFETVTLVAHDGRPVASRCLFEEGGEAAATAALLEDVDVRGRLVTLDALHSSLDMERRLVEMHGADCLFAVKANCPETFEALAALDWDAPGVRRHEAPPEKAHGRVEERSVAARDLPGGMLRFQHARQAFRVRRHRTVVKTGRTAEETVYGICSVAAERAGPERLLAWNPRPLDDRERQPPPPRRQPGRGRLPRPRPPRAGQQRPREQHRPRRRPAPRLPLRARSPRPLLDAPRGRLRRRPLARLAAAPRPSPPSRSVPTLPGGRHPRPVGGIRRKERRNDPEHQPKASRPSHRALAPAQLAPLPLLPAPRP